MLIDEIGLAQEAEKRRERILFTILGLVVLAAGIYTLVHRLTMDKNRGDDSQKTNFFAGHAMQIPPRWHRDGDISTVESLHLSRGSDPITMESITLEDLRTHPENPDGFQGEWMARTDLDAKSIDPYHDASVNAVGASCVRIDWGGTSRRLKIVCLSNDGRWKATLVGGDRDIRAMDTIIEQFLLLEN